MCKDENVTHANSFITITKCTLKYEMTSIVTRHHIRACWSASEIPVIKQMIQSIFNAYTVR